MAAIQCLGFTTATGGSPPRLRSAGTPRPPATPAFVYRRRRLTAAGILLGALLAGGAALGVLRGGSLTAPEAGTTETTTVVVQPVSRATHVVAPGETMWSIARSLQPSGDVRPLVDSLVAARGSRPLQPGERIELPALRQVDVRPRR